MQLASPDDVSTSTRDGRQNAERRVRWEREARSNNPASLELYSCDPTYLAWLNDIAASREVSSRERARHALALEGLAPDDAGYQEALAVRSAALSRYPVLMISAPHIDEALNAHFPGEPTPLLYAIAPSQQAARLGLMASAKLPDIEVMHGHVFDDAFRRHLREILEHHKPWVVGISNMAEAHYNALEIARMVKAHNPSVTTIMGGSHEDGTNPLGFEREATKRGGLGPESRRRLERLRTLGVAEEREIVDFVVCGDGPYILWELLALAGQLERPDSRSLRLRVDEDRLRLGSTRGAGEVFFAHPTTGELSHVSFAGPPIDRNCLPFIDRRYSTRNRYACFDYEPTAQVMWNDGCVETCTFCHEAKEHLLYGSKKVRRRSAQNMVAEIEQIVLTQGVQKLFFDDSTFTQFRTPTRELLDRLIELRERESLTFEWGCQTTITRVDEAMLQQMAQAGCSYIYFGLEGAAPDPAVTTKARRLVGRDGSPRVALPQATDEPTSGWLARFLAVAGWCHASGIRVGASLQFGLGEQGEDILRLFRELRRLYALGAIPDHCVALNMNAIYPGTEQYRLEVIEGGADIDYRRKLRRHPGFETQHDHCPQPLERAVWIHERAVELLGPALVGYEA